ncbi:MAG: MBL fold metallo-hydrolase [Verrucomicrobia bacterium]|nr:MBL fold metallo-hydrolase [Verrucomicrobiota bacterium]
MTPVPLEDCVADVVGKAMRGLKLNDPLVAAQAGVTAAAVASLRDGRFDEATARAIAPVLHLGADALAALGHRAWYPQPVVLAGLACFNTPYADMTVNSYLAFDRTSGEAVAFDTGADCSGMLDFLARENLTLKLILLTHTHIDHILELEHLKQHSGTPAWVGERESFAAAQPFAAGREFHCGVLRIATRLTWGHSRGGITYVIAGLARPLAVVGDAVFAASMGGGAVSYADALRTNREQILSLPAATILCPGHGPLTTVGEEQAHNPFFAGWHLVNPVV